MPGTRHQPRPALHEPAGHRASSVPACWRKPTHPNARNGTPRIGPAESNSSAGHAARNVMAPSSSRGRPRHRPAAAGRQRAAAKTRVIAWSGIVQPFCRNSLQACPKGNGAVEALAPGRANHYASASFPAQKLSLARPQADPPRSKEHPRAPPAAAGRQPPPGSWGRADCGGGRGSAPAFSLAISPRVMAVDTRQCRCDRAKPTTCDSGARGGIDRPQSPPPGTTISSPASGEGRKKRGGGDQLERSEGHGGWGQGC